MGKIYLDSNIIEIIKEINLYVEKLKHRTRIKPSELLEHINEKLEITVTYSALVKILEGIESSKDCPKILEWIDTNKKKEILVLDKK